MRNLVSRSVPLAFLAVFVWDFMWEKFPKSAKIRLEI